MTRCTCCSALLRGTPQRAAYVRVLDGEPVGMQAFPLCDRCIARAATHPLEINAAMARAYNALEAN